MPPRALHASLTGAAILISAGFVLAVSAASVARAATEDSYTLALSWEPGFCGEGDHAALPECKLAANTAARLVLHGLWPDWDTNGDGKRDAADDYCLPDANDRQAIIGLDQGSQDWLKLPEVKLSPANAGDLAGVMPGTASALERHEWWKHGICSGLKPDDYFATAILLARQVQRSPLAHLIAERAGKSIERSKLLAAFAAEFGTDSARALLLDCVKSRGESALLEIRIQLQRGKIAQGLNRDSLAIPEKPPRGGCAAGILIPNWRK